MINVYQKFFSKSKKQSMLFFLLQIKSNLFFEDARQIHYDNIAYSRTSSEKHGKARRLKTYKIISNNVEINYAIAVWP